MIPCALRLVLACWLQVAWTPGVGSVDQQMLFVGSAGTTTPGGFLPSVCALDCACPVDGRGVGCGWCRGHQCEGPDCPVLVVREGMQACVAPAVLGCLATAALCPHTPPPSHRRRVILPLGHVRSMSARAPAPPPLSSLLTPLTCLCCKHAPACVYAAAVLAVLSAGRRCGVRKRDGRLGGCCDRVRRRPRALPTHTVHQCRVVRVRSAGHGR